MDNFDILIVDDDKNLNFALCETIKRKKYNVDSANSFLEAKKKLQEYKWPGKYKRVGKCYLQNCYL